MIRLSRPIITTTLGVIVMAAWLVIMFVVAQTLSANEAIESSPVYERVEKRLLEVGWNTPFLQEMPEYIDEAQHTPFDGLVLDVAGQRGRRGLAWSVFSAQPFDEAQFDQIAQNLEGLAWGRLTDNFLRINIYPADLDWFDAFDAVLHNVEAMAHLAYRLGFAGLFLDTEQYPGVTLFDYTQRAYRDRYTHAEYDAQAFRRGQEIMQAINRGFPGATVIYTFGLTTGSQASTSRDLSTFHYGLLIPFIEGMIDSADEGTWLADGFEQSYTFSDEAQFRSAYRLIKEFTVHSYARNPIRYGEFVQAGFGLWLDHNACGEPGLRPENCAPGFTPQSFQQAVDLALRHSDRYVWIYSQGVNWYTGQGIPPEWAETLATLGQ